MMLKVAWKPSLIPPPIVNVCGNNDYFFMPFANCAIINL